MTTDNTNNTDKLVKERTNTLDSDDEFLYKEESCAIRGVLFEVYNQIGCGFLEGVYQECLIHEFRLRKIPFLSQPKFQIFYKGDLLDCTYQPDFVCYEKIIIELKAVKELTAEHRAQTLNYLKASGLSLGLLINFGNSPRVNIERFIL